VCWNLSINTFKDKNAKAPSLKASTPTAMMMTLNTFLAGKNQFLDRSECIQDRVTRENCEEFALPKSNEGIPGLKNNPKYTRYFGQS
jgi:hypothetical protein